MLGIALDVWRGIYGVGATFNPASLFAGGELGLWHDPSDISTAYQDSAGTTPVTAATQPVGKVNDKSGRGNHALQATSGARPTYSARVNLLEKTEEFSDAIWTPNTVFSTLIQTTAPDASNTAATFTGDGTSNVHLVGQIVGPGGNTISVKAKKGTARYLQVLFDNVANAQVNFDLQLGTFSLGAGAVSASITAAEGGYYLCTAVSSGTPINVKFILVTSLVAIRLEPNTISGSINLWQPQVETGTTATTYQRVNTASDYDTVGFPTFLNFDGVNDELATGAITLGADMDCFIAVRRNSSANLLLAYGDSVSKNFGITQSGNFGVTSTNAGTPTLAVNGVSISGGTSATCDQLHQATPSGSWSVVETRNLDLSLWTEFKFGRYLGYQINGDIGGIILCPAQTTEKRNQIRTYLGAKVGLTL